MMGITLFLVAGIAVLCTATYAVAPRVISEPQAADENTVVGLGQSSEDTLSGGTPARRPREWHVTTVQALREAEDLLDCLESQGFAERELVILGNSSFAVRWR